MWKFRLIDMRFALTTTSCVGDFGSGSRQEIRVVVGEEKAKMVRKSGIFNECF